MDSVIPTVLGFNDTWENRHLTALLFQRRDLPQRLADLRQAPVLLQLTAVQYRPLSDEAKGCSRVDGTDEHVAVEVELPLEPLVLRVKVRWFVIVLEHPDDDPEED
ncbi:MAG: hypothetical protein A2X53_11010 [Candidatus Rokubacteria bacterium GWA2_70_23]|nr:MAG: hypothetical protein A2X53_11010 [Candidatus Rokubacteria bacterium GWA2_70_23]